MNVMNSLAPETAPSMKFRIGSLQSSPGPQLRSSAFLQFSSSWSSAKSSMSQAMRVLGKKKWAQESGEHLSEILDNINHINPYQPYAPPKTCWTSDP